IRAVRLPWRYDRQDARDRRLRLRARDDRRARGEGRRHRSPGARGARVGGGGGGKEGHGLVPEDLGEVLEELPERLLVGTGAYGQMRPDSGALETLRARGVDVEVLPTAEAVRRYAELDP